ncbi:cytochrome [Mycolicibacterium moriokaense]|uniref:Steroid C26-monooxygenase n=2 Tax=Mycolicibacterium TaxID=1866885 RepID=A0AAD1H6W6_9MYCO|nr:cytochrome P450 [Mycolicibacterium moriokaense]MCV7057775.1 cytochrome P450 [Mycolicibacterium gilvum]MCV7042480.1 cytochrome P450 [Mycolicibacterium moriokaense]ORB14084.1 cytochrome [Mycolicibacterium moriokaense]STZ41115.1 cytochrome P450 [Mycolicibacterium gilvum]BBW99153.1 cytochrome P450 [Mycolicibacterium moriokaense]
MSDQQPGTHPGRCTALEALGHDYDHYDPQFALDPHADYTALRAKCPVAHTDNYGGFYVITKYEDISAVLLNAQVFSSWPADTPPTPGHTRALIPLEVDPPEHRRYRTIIDPLFRPKAIEHIADEVRRYAAELVDTMVAKREFDFMTEFAEPYPSSVFLRLVGLDFDVAQRDQLCSWASTILHTTTNGVEHGDVEAQTTARLQAGKALNNFLRALLDERLANPGEDIISYLTTAEMPGARKLDYREILNFAYVMVLAGLDTVSTAIGFSFLHLARRPDLQDRLAADPSLIPAAIEELLRYEPIVHGSRTVTEETAINGVELHPGDRVVIPLASAHRDEDAYPDADQILIDRHADKSMIFGAGNHRCVGSHLARLELNIAFEEIFRKIPKFSIPEHAQLAAYGGQTRSLITLPFRTWRD